MNSAESGRSGNIAQLFVVTAALELGAGLALLLAPAVIITLLFGSAVEVSAAIGITRLTGVALLSIGAACWWARVDQGSVASRAIVWALLSYNAGVLALVLLGGLGAFGLAQGAAVSIHGVMGIWCTRILVR